MKALLYIFSFVLLDAIVPRSCRSAESIERYQYEYEDDSLDFFEDEEPDSLACDTLTDSIAE